MTIEHAAPWGDFTETVNEDVIVLGRTGVWISDSLGRESVDGVGELYLEKLEGHTHLARLE